MGASITWRPVNSGTYLEVNAPSSFMDAFARAGLELPCRLDESCIGILTGLKAAMQGEENAFDDLLAAIEKHGGIMVSASW